MTALSPATTQSLSRIEHRCGRRQLVVDDAPFLLLGGELHNSSGSDASAIAAGLDRAVAMNANTALVPVTWELLEPIEGSFDLSLVDIALAAARQRGLRLVLLWFGTWKNGRSSYIPGWVKKDTTRFPRAVLSDGRPTEHLSPFGHEAMRSDAAAFAHLMEHLRRVDSAIGTVVMVQVENEVGLLGDSRDRSALAEEAFDDHVPDAIIDLLVSGSLAATAAWEKAGRASSGSWSELFGGDISGDEAFMTHAYARYVEHVAAVGAAQHDVPLFTNAWLDSEIDVPGFAVTGGQRPGTYPSGGPVAGVASIWRTLAPTLELVAPDIYVGDFDAISARFAAANDGALLIPEMRRDEEGAGQIAVAVGRHGALGVSPFGIDSGEPGDLDAIADLYTLMQSIAEALTRADLASVTGFHVQGPDDVQELHAGRRRFRARASRTPWGEDRPTHGYGVVIETAPDEFLAIGRGFVLEPVAERDRLVGILAIDELAVTASGLTAGRRLNGDETRSGSAWVHPARGHAPTGGLPIPSVGENSGISRCRLYEFS